MTLFEFQICRVGQGLLGIRNRDEILDMNTRDLYFLWDSISWAQPYKLETQIGNRLLTAIISSGMIEDRKKANDDLLIVDEVREENKVYDEIDSLEHIGK